LKTKEVNIIEKKEKRVSSQLSPHKNPNQYNGEVLETQHNTTKNPNSKQVYIVSYGCM